MRCSMAGSNTDIEEIDQIADICIESSFPLNRRHSPPFDTIYSNSIHTQKKRSKDKRAKESHNNNNKSYGIFAFM